MIANLFRRNTAQANIDALYGAIVAQARQPWFYTALNVPDTMEARFDMIVLHLALVMRRLRNTGPDAQNVAQRLFDRFCRDLDHHLREMGISDIAVPRKMQRLGEAFYGRAAAYDRALDEGGTEALAAALNRNVYGSDDADHDGPKRLAAYVHHCDRDLAAREASELAGGAVAFPLPADAAD